MSTTVRGVSRSVLGRDIKSLLYAVLLHGTVVILLVANFYWPDSSRRQVENVIKARVVLDAPAREKAERPVEPKPVAAPKPDTQALERKRAEEQKQRLAQEKARKAEQKKKQEQLRKQEAAAAEKRRQQKARQELLKAMEAEEQERQSQANEARAVAAMTEFEALIRQQVTRNWNQPTGVPRGLSCLVRVRLAAGGEILGVKIMQSSGNALFDRSVENAVYKAAPLPVPQDPELFKYVREINIRFDPDD